MKIKGMMAGVAGLAALGMGISTAARADDLIRLGILTDMSGSYADMAGPGSVVAAEMAIKDFGGMALGKPIELVSGDHQNKPDVGAATAREWYDSGTDAIFELVSSSVALAVYDVANTKQKLAIVSGAGTTALTGENCSAFGAQWSYDTYALAKIVAGMADEASSSSWYFVTVDYNFGKSLQEITAKTLEAAGAKVVGSVLHPLGATDFSSFLLQAQASGADVVALANAGGDLVNAIRQATEFGIVASGQKLVALAGNITDIDALGLEGSQGLIYADAFYWDLNEQSRDFANRYFAIHGKMPTMAQAGVYSSILHYLKAVEAVGSDDAATVMAKMRELPVNDAFTQNGKLREDGRMVHDMYRVQIKTPAESQYPWDYYKILAVVPGDEAFRPLAESTCPLIKK